MELSKEQRIARHKDFLNANWKLIASFSWGQYLEKCKGAVLVPEEDFVHANVPVLKGLRFRYLPVREKDSEQFKGVLAEKELAWLETYDPDLRVVLCILREGGGISSYLFGGSCRCSEAYERQKAERN